MRKWWIYQKERFPVVANGMLIAVFSGAAVGYSALLRKAPMEWEGFVAAFVFSLAAFAHLRIADEFKDAEEDRQFRPYRPVPRGLVTLRELGVVAALLAVLQVGAAFWLDPRLLPWLLVVWIYLGLMSREFFLGDRLRSRPLTYMWTHMLIMPLIDFFGTACDWVPAAGSPPAGLGWFVAASFFNGMVIEIGRKIRDSSDEEKGVVTYSSLWGMQRAVEVWVVVMLAVVLCVFGAEQATGFFYARIATPLLLVIICLLGLWFVKNPAPGRGRLLELAAGVWTLVLYVTLGLLPHLSGNR